MDTAFSKQQQPLTEDIIKTIPAAPFTLKPTDKKYFLFLDLDETLIHSFTVPRTEFASERERKEYYDEISRLLTIENGIAPTQEELECYPSEMVFNIRPGTEEFLAQLSKHYELSIFTAGE